MRVPGQRRTIALRFMLRRIRDTQKQKRPPLPAGAFESR